MLPPVADALLAGDTAAQSALPARTAATASVDVFCRMRSTSSSCAAEVAARSSLTVVPSSDTSLNGPDPIGATSEPCPEALVVVVELGAGFVTE